MSSPTIFLKWSQDEIFMSLMLLSIYQKAYLIGINSVCNFMALVQIPLLIVYYYYLTSSYCNTKSVDSDTVDVDV